MVYGAKRSLAEMERDALTKDHLAAYTNGVNYYIDHLKQSELPLEYRLLNYTPERWTPLKCALLLKYLSFDLTGSESDIEHTNAKAYFTESDFRKMYPLMNDSASPVIPKGTYFPPASDSVFTPGTADSLYFQWKEPVNVLTIKTDKDNGSNNWAVAGSKTVSGKPILCNDPHLGLNLPSLWYEVQITTPEFSVYGASLPGSPSVIIGFNDHIAWGVTNAARDVIDYYKIEFDGTDKSQYRFNNAWKKSELVVENYLVKNGPAFIDTVAYTSFGPVMYDNRFNGKGRVGANVNLAVRWTAHDPSNELRAFIALNKARSYEDYNEAIQFFQCPGQNFVFAGKSGDIALWQQGKFPNKWNMQGDFIMPGTDSTYSWQAYIPQQENPHIYNPESGYVSSANQIAADTNYPYYLGGDYDVYRGLQINRMLGIMSGITPDDMQRLQNENYNALAEMAVPVLIQHLRQSDLSMAEEKYFSMVRDWNYRNDNDMTGPTIFTTWLSNVEDFLWKDELTRQPGASEMPGSATTVDLLRSDSALSFIDDVTTPEKETLDDIITNAFKKAAMTVDSAESEGRLKWSQFKDAGIRHLLRIEPFSRYHLNTGGGRHVINATQQYKGPSWKMVVHLTDNTEAYGIYPGGQIGNAGSKRYDEFVNDWADGKYYRLWQMKKEEASDQRVKYTIKFSPSL
jgi:penicillin amidase